MTDFDKAILDPAAVFHVPRNVLDTSDLTTGQKIEILHRWEFDTREMEVADDEGMPCTQEVDMLDEILNCLKQLGTD